jgi:hypothetical protein
MVSPELSPASLVVPSAPASLEASPHRSIAPAPQLPPLQRSPPVQALPSSQGVLFEGWVQLPSLQKSSVQAFLSSQSASLTHVCPSLVPMLSPN